MAKSKEARGGLGTGGKGTDTAGGKTVHEQVEVKAAPPDDKARAKAEAATRVHAEARAKAEEKAKTAAPAGKLTKDTVLARFVNPQSVSAGAIHALGFQMAVEQETLAVLDHIASEVPADKQQNILKKRVLRATAVWHGNSQNKPLPADKKGAFKEALMDATQPGTDMEALKTKIRQHLGKAK